MLDSAVLRVACVAVCLQIAGCLLQEGDYRMCSGDCTGVVRRALDFTTGNHTMVANVSESLSSTSGGVTEFTFELWISIRHCLGQDSCTVARYQDHAHDFVVALRKGVPSEMSPSGWEITARMGNHTHMHVAIPEKIWVHAAFVYNRQESAVFIMGKERYRGNHQMHIGCSFCHAAGTFQCSQCFLPYVQPWSNNSMVTLGGMGPISDFDGRLSEVRVWSKDMSQLIPLIWDVSLVEVWDGNNLKNGEPYTASRVVNVSYLVAYWKLEMERSDTEDRAPGVMDKRLSTGPTAKHYMKKLATEEWSLGRVWRDAYYGQDHFINDGQDRFIVYYLGEQDPSLATRAMIKDPANFGKLLVWNGWAATNEIWPKAWTFFVPPINWEDKPQQISKLLMFPRSGPAEGGTKTRLLMKNLYGGVNSLWGARVIPAPQEETNELQPAVASPNQTTSRRIREPFHCEQLAASDDRRLGNRAGPGGGAGTIDVIGTGELLTKGSVVAVAGHTGGGSIELYNSTGFPVDPSLAQRRFEVFHKAHAFASSIVIADFDQNGKSDVLLFGEKSELFLQVESCPLCPPYFAEGDIFVKHVSELSPLTKWREQQPECLECMEAPDIGNTSQARVVAVATDMNGDHYPDLLVGIAGNKFRLLLNNHTHFLDSGLTNLPNVDDIANVKVGDFLTTGNLRKDLLFVGFAGTSQIFGGSYALKNITWWSNFSQNFPMRLNVADIALRSQLTHSPASNAIIADFNGDLYMDIAVATSDGSGHQVFLSQATARKGPDWLTSSSASFQQLPERLGTTAGSGLVVGDADSDGDMDLYAVATEGADSLWLNNGFGIFTLEATVADYPAATVSVLSDPDDFLPHATVDFPMARVATEEDFAIEHAYAMSHPAWAFEKSLAYMRLAEVNQSVPVSRKIVAGTVSGSLNGVIWSIADVQNQSSRATFTPGKRVRRCQSLRSPLAVSLRAGFGDVRGDGGIGGILSVGLDGQLQDAAAAQNLTGDLLFTWPRSSQFRHQDVTFRDIIPDLAAQEETYLRALIHPITGSWWFAEMVDFTTISTNRTGISLPVVYTGGREAYMHQTMWFSSFSFYQTPTFPNPVDFVTVPLDKLHPESGHPVMRTITIHGESFHNPTGLSSAEMELAVPNTNQYSFRHLEYAMYSPEITVRFLMSANTTHIGKRVMYAKAVFISEKIITVVPPFHMIVGWNLTAAMEISFNQQNYHQVPGLLHYAAAQHTSFSTSNIDCSNSVNITITGRHYFASPDFKVRAIPLDGSESWDMPAWYISSTEIKFLWNGQLVSDIHPGYGIQVALNATGNEFSQAGTVYCYNSSLVPMTPRKPVLRYPNLTANGPFLRHELLENVTRFAPGALKEGFQESFQSAKGLMKFDPFAPGSVSIGDFQGSVDLGMSQFCRYQNTTSNVNYLHSAIHQTPRLFDQIDTTAEVNKLEIPQAEFDPTRRDFRPVGCFLVPRSPLVATGPRNSYLLKQNETGGPVWAVNYGGSANTTSKALLITRDRTIFNAFLASGAVTFEEKAIEIATRNSRLMQFQSDQVGSPFRANQKRTVRDGVRRAYTLPSTMSDAAFRKIVFSRYDRFGIFLWAREAASCHYNDCDFDALQFDEHENVYMVGEFQGMMNFGVRWRTNNSVTERNCPLVTLDAKPTRPMLDASSPPECTPNGLRSSAVEWEHKTQSSDHSIGDGGVALPLVSLVSRSSAQPEQLCDTSRGQKPICVKDVYISMFDRNGTLFWVRNLHTRAQWMRSTPLREFYSRVMNDWEKSTSEYYWNTFAKVLRPVDKSSIVSALRDEYADLPEVYNSLAWTYYQEFHAYPFESSMWKPPTDLRAAMTDTVLKIHQIFDNIKNAANFPCCAVTCNSVPCPTTTSQQLLDTLSAPVADITNSTTMKKFGDTLSPSIVQTGSRIAYLRQFFAMHKYDYEYLYFNRDQLKEIIDGVDKFVQDVNTASSTQLPLWISVPPNDVVALTEALSSDRASLLRVQQIYSILPTSDDVAQMMSATNPPGTFNTNTTRRFFWTTANHAHLLDLLRLARSKSPGVCCPMARSIDIELTHQEIEAVLSVQGPLVEQWPLAPTSLDLNKGVKAGLWVAISLAGTQFYPLNSTSRLRLIEQMRSFSMHPGATQFDTVVKPLLISNAQSSSQPQLMKLDSRRMLLNISLPLLDEGLIVGSNPLFNQPSLLTDSLPYKINSTESVTLSIPASMVEDGKGYWNVASFGVRPEPTGTILQHQPDPMVNLIPGVLEDQIRLSNLTLKVFLAVDQFRPLNTPLRKTSWPYREYTVQDAFVLDGLKSDIDLTAPNMSQSFGGSVVESMISQHLTAVSADQQSVSMLFTGFAKYSIVDREIVSVSIPESTTLRGTNYPSIAQFMIRRARASGTAVVPFRGLGTTSSNWNVAEIDEYLVQLNGKCIDFVMATNRYFNLTTHNKLRVVALLDAGASHNSFLGFRKRVIPKLENSVDELVQVVENNSTLRICLPSFTGVGIDKYDIDYPETIELTIPADITTHGTNHPFRPIYMKPSPGGTLLAEQPLVSEHDIRDGLKTLILSVGGLLEGHTIFNQIMTKHKMAILETMVNKLYSGQKDQPRGWTAAVVPTMLHALWRQLEVVDERKMTSVKITLPVCTGAKIDSIQTQLYDIVEPETISIYIPGFVLLNGQDQPFESFVIQPDPSGTLFESSPREIAAGGPNIVIWLGKDMFLEDSIAIPAVLGSIRHPHVDASSQQSGFNFEILPKLIASWAEHVKIDRMRTRMTITIPASNFNVTYPEDLRIDIPKGATESGKRYAGQENGGLFMGFIPAFIAGTLFFEPGKVSASTVRMGGATMLFQLDDRVYGGPGGGLHTSYPTGAIKNFNVHSAFESDVRDGFLADPSITQGFSNVVLADWLTPGNLIWNTQDDAHTLRITLGAYPQYAIDAPETVRFAVSPTMITNFDLLTTDPTSITMWASFTIYPN